MKERGDSKQRYIKQQLIGWKNSYNRKPLILRGARQVVKTYILKEFGEEQYEGVAYFNFDHNTKLDSKEIVT